MLAWLASHRVEAGVDDVDPIDPPIDPPDPEDPPPEEPQANQQPVLNRSTGIVISDGSSFNLITRTRLEATDPDDLPDQLTYTLKTPPANGNVKLNGVALVQGDTWTQQDINDEQLAYDHTNLGTTTDSFSFEVADGGEDGTVAVAGVFSVTIPTKNSLIGVNTGFITDFSSDPTFADVLRNNFWHPPGIDGRTSGVLDECNADQIPGSHGLVRYHAIGVEGEVFKVRIRKKSNYDLPGNATLQIKGDTIYTITQDTDLIFTAADISKGGNDTLLDTTITQIDSDTVVEVWRPRSNVPPVGGNPDDPQYKFFPEFVKALQPYSINRNLDPMRINRENEGDSQPIIRTPADQIPWERSSQAGPQFGCNIKHFLDMCLIGDNDLWICFPHTADDDLVRDWMEKIIYFATVTRPGTIVYIEFSNETWNSGKKQSSVSDPTHPLYPYAAYTIGLTDPRGTQYTDDIRERNFANSKGTGLASGDFFNRLEAIATDIDPNFDYIEIVGIQVGSGDTHTHLIMEHFHLARGKYPGALAGADYVSWRKSARFPDGRTATIQNAIQAVTGTTAETQPLEPRAWQLNGRPSDGTIGVYEAIGSSVDYRDLTPAQQADFDNHFATVYAADGQYLTAAQLVAIDNYLVTNHGRTWMVDLMIDSPNHGLALSASWLQNKMRLCNEYGVRFMRYEFNVHLNPSSIYLDWRNEFVEAHKDPRIEELTYQAAQQWFQYTDGDAQCYFVLSGEIRDSNVFGIHESFIPELDSTARSRAFLRTLQPSGN